MVEEGLNRFEVFQWPTLLNGRLWQADTEAEGALYKI